MELKNVKLSSDFFNTTEDVFNKYINSPNLKYGQFVNDTDGKILYFINLIDVACEYSNLRLEDGIIYGDVLVMDTPHGKILKEKIDRGLYFRFGIVGIGDSDENFAYHLTKKKTYLIMFLKLKSPLTID